MPLAPEKILTAEQIKSLDEKYGEDNYSIVRKANRRDPSKYDYEIAIRKPTAAEYQLFKSRSMSDASKVDAQKNLVKQTLIHPSPDEFKALLDVWHAICESSAVSAAIQEMTGMASIELEKA